MKRFLPGVIGLVGAGVTAPALAADLPTRPYYPPPIFAPVYDWSGFFFGANAGWAADAKCWGVTNDFGIPQVPTANAGCSRGSGGEVGGQIGYRWQWSYWVLGVEAQGDWSDLKGSRLSLVNALVTNQSQVRGFGLFTGQVGYVWNNALVYLKGGAAVTSDKYDGMGTATGIVFDRASETRLGGTLGGGIEFGLAPNWSIALEYDHLFMGSANNTFISTGLGVNNRAAAGVPSRTINIGENVDIGTVRVNYRFGGPVVAKY